MRVVALEGLVHAGKTTLLRNIRGSGLDVRCIGEYVEFVEDRFPKPPKNTIEAMNSHVFFLKLEQKRRREIRKNDNIVLLDRSVFSILAYHYATEVRSGGEIACFEEGVASIPHENWLFPSVCVYLDVSDELIEARHHGDEGFYQSMFLEMQFNALLREFYEKVMPQRFSSVNVVKIDAGYSKEVIITQLGIVLAATAS